MNFRDLYHVYFIKPAGLLGPIKIGLSCDPARRFREFSSWSPMPLEILATVPGRWDDEQFLHSCLAEHHSHGEWFHAEPLVLDAIKSVIDSNSFEELRAIFAPMQNLRSKKNRATRAATAGIPKYPRRRAA